MSSPAPIRPERPDTSPPRGSCLGMMLIGSGIFLVLVVLSFLTLGVFANVAIGIGAILAFAGFHYLVWGWWLGGIIRREVEAEEQRQQAKSDD